jgi:hypothetical protein
MEESNVQVISLSTMIIYFTARLQLVGLYSLIIVIAGSKETFLNPLSCSSLKITWRLRYQKMASESTWPYNDLQCREMSVKSMKTASFQ